MSMKFYGIGNLTKDVEVRTVNDKSVAVFSIAVNDGFGEREHVSYFNCEMWGDKKVEALQKYGLKGIKLHVDGQLYQDRYEKDGENKTVTKLKVADFMVLTPKKQNTSTEENKEEVATEVEDEKVPF